jgi:hypothetical protein
MGARLAARATGEHDNLTALGVYVLGTRGQSAVAAHGGAASAAAPASGTSAQVTRPLQPPAPAAAVPPAAAGVHPRMWSPWISAAFMSALIVFVLAAVVLAWWLVPGARTYLNGLIGKNDTAQPEPTYVIAFRRGFEAFSNKDWDQAAKAMTEARTVQAEGPTVLTVQLENGVFEPYLPSYFLGTALAKQENCKDANVAWQHAVRATNIKDTKYWPQLQKDRDLCATNKIGQATGESEERPNPPTPPATAPSTPDAPEPLERDRTADGERAAEAQHRIRRTREYSRCRRITALPAVVLHWPRLL